jgi:exonuclease III
MTKFKKGTENLEGNAARILLLQEVKMQDFNFGLKLLISDKGT